MQLLRGDGSDRIFLRINGTGRNLIAILPSPTLPLAQAEARAVWDIGRHLACRKVSIPTLFGFDSATGIVLCEDLGDAQLHGVVRGLGGGDEVMPLYRQALDTLLQMQLGGAEGFDPSWCWDTPSYDRQLMLSRESGYFWESCCRDYLGLTVMPPGVKRDFLRLAELAVAQPAGFFLHRDFQSRNLIVKDGRIRVLDFQGGRLGPLAYDLASLLNDPYVDLPQDRRDNLFSYYLGILGERRPDLATGFTDGYLWLALQRNLQILGAFAFLTRVRGKVFFQNFLGPAADNLVRLLNGAGAGRLPELRALASELPDRLKHQKNTE